MERQQDTGWREGVSSMDLLTLIILIVAVGVFLWAINTYVPMEAGIKKLLNIVVIVVLVLYILSLFIGYFPKIPVGR